MHIPHGGKQPGEQNVVDKHWTEWKNLELWGWVAPESVASQQISLLEEPQEGSWVVSALAQHYMALLVHLTRNPQPPLCRFIFVSSIWSCPFSPPKEPFGHFEY